MTGSLVNLVADLHDAQYAPQAFTRAVSAMEQAGFTVEEVTPGTDAFLAWIDDVFGGTWSSEAFAGSSIVAKRGDRFAGFATYGAQGLRFSWLRGLGAQPGVGIFGPFGVAPEFRGSAAGPNLLIAALASLRRVGYRRALIPAVGHEKLTAYYRRYGGEIAEVFDRAQWQNRKYRTVVLASGNGTNFQSVLDGVAAERLPLEITLLLSNRSGAYALERAKNAGIATAALPWDRGAQPRKIYDGLLQLAVRAAEPELVLLLGWMHLLPEDFVAAFPAMLNIHPAFLPLDRARDDVGFPDGSVTPAFRGPRAVEDALAWGARWTGASCHHVSTDMDRGPVLARAPLTIRAGETAAAVFERLHPLEHKVLASSIMRWVYER